VLRPSNRWPRIASLSGLEAEPSDPLEFSNSMLPVYYSRWGVHHEISRHQALYRDRWPQNER
jgi:hypothetical protein